MKTNKTKLSALAALLAVVIGVSACGSGSGTKSTADNEIAQAANALKEEMGEKDFNEAASAIKDELAKDEAKETETAEETIKEIVPTDEILNADMYANTYQLGNTVFSFPISVKDFIAAGATLKNGKDPAVQVVGKNSNSEKFEFLIDNYVFTAHIHNKTDEAKYLTDFNIDAVYTGVIYVGNGNVIFPKSKESVVFPGGIMKGSTIAELDEKWGEPQIDELDKRTYIKDYVNIRTGSNSKRDYINVSGCSYTVSLDLDNGVVSNIINDIAEDTDELTVAQTPTYWMGKMNYSIPKKLTDGYMIFEYNGKKYVLQKGNLDIERKPDIGEFNDESMEKYLSGLSYDEEYLYDYKIDGSVCTLVESLNHKDYAEVNVAKYTDEERFAYVTFYIMPCEEEELTADIIKSQNDLLFEIAASINPAD